MVDGQVEERLLSLEERMDGHDCTFEVQVDASINLAEAVQRLQMAVDQLNRIILSQRN